MPITPFAAAAAATFNLVCAGNVASNDVTGETTTPFSYTYRIDLDKSLYCDGECKATRAINEVKPAYLILDSKSVDSPSEKSMNSMTIDRETGELKGLATYESHRIGPASILLMKWTGKCEKADFTGFPAPVTKF